MSKIGIASDHAGYEMKRISGRLPRRHGLRGARFRHAFARQRRLCRLRASAGRGDRKRRTRTRHRPLRLGRRDDDDPQQASGHPRRPGLGAEIASLIRRHNNANIIVFPARFITNDEAVAMLDAYFAAQFEGGRHEHRIEKMAILAAQPGMRQK